MIESLEPDDDDEIAMGEEAAHDLVQHMKRTKAAWAEFRILDEGAQWVISIERKPISTRLN
jgi:hypothetical protein